MDSSESQKLQGYPVMGGWSPHFVLLDQVLTMNIGEKSPHSSSRGGEKEKHSEIGQTILSLLTRSDLRRNYLTRTSPAGIL